ncbi:DNA glycosylase AlkZ-like family protein [Conexibacter woesei]|uniref:Winged helix DNA-binding domain-containing protein n=1 Tax=Conexibacter woesei (strain DSM 14684 / CCUG 47730 / CIP 108061 / JCM 11494 / NBRC 100937 / ID131577) TaxID=469383 RepID=D3F0B6_CONWI|nr:crosslink repair DNA glycosylase YcaQ family protein [Conexibacter woesei]ADB51976.1 hypothetical protein Cwoe_3558 [Conexibacter woesei DSM 14684]
MQVSPAQIVAFRIAAHALAARDATPLGALASWSVQDSPAGAAALALAARSATAEPGWLDAALHDDRSAVALYNPRTATAIVAADDVATFAAGLLPPDEEALRLVLGGALPPAGEGPQPDEAVRIALPAFEQALDGRQLSRDDLHAELRERLPEELLPWCEGCQSHHARRGLLVAAGLHGRLCIAGRAGRQPLFARTDQWIGEQATPPAAARDRHAAAAEVVRRHLRGSGPSTPALFAGWAGIAPQQAQRAWALVETELAEVAIERPDGGAGRAWLLAGDAPALAAAEPARGTILLAAGDPLLLARDRELLLPDAATRKRAWPAINPPGLLLHDGATVALWRGRKRGRVLAVELEPLGRPLSKRALTAVERAAKRLAPHRGCTSATVQLAA